MSSRLGDLLQRRGDLTARAARARRSSSSASTAARSSSHLVQARLRHRGEAALVPRARVPPAGRRPARRSTSRPRCSALVPPALVQKHHLIPTNLVRSTLTLAMADPSNLIAIDEVKFLTGYDVKVAVAGADRDPARDRALLRQPTPTTTRCSPSSTTSDVEVVQRRGRGRPPGARARHRGGAGRQARERAPHRRDQEAGERHPRRAVREDAPRPLPHRRRALRDDAAAAAS